MKRKKMKPFRKQLAIYDILVDQQPNDYFDHVSGSELFNAGNRYFKVKCQLKGRFGAGYVLDEEIAQRRWAFVFWPSNG